MIKSQEVLAVDANRFWVSNIIEIKIELIKESYLCILGMLVLEVCDRD